MYKTYQSMMIMLQIMKRIENGWLAQNNPYV